ncbi:MAG: flagellar basal body rod protein FlgC [Burkholderiales bacterium]
MSLFNVFDIAGSAMTAQSQRLNVVASNLANAESTGSADGGPYRAKQLVFAAQPLKANAPGAIGVRVQGVIDDPSPMRKVFDPKHPHADATGYVTYPNVNVVEEMVNMISASRSYQASVDVMDSARVLVQRTLALGQ